VREERRRRTRRGEIEAAEARITPKPRADK
jgi:hypothetical protein